MNTPKTKQGKRSLKLAILGLALLFGGLQSQAQQSQEEDEEVESNERPFFNGLNQENFKSDLVTDQNRNSVNYSIEGNRRRENNYDIFGNDKNQNQRFEEIQTEQRIQTNTNGSIMIQSPQGKNESVNPTVGNNMPTIVDPFRQTQQGVKSPRNMDAVPDNGDDPNDVPLDGGVVILGLAATAFGIKRKK